MASFFKTPVFNFFILEAQKVINIIRKMANCVTVQSQKIYEILINL